MYRKKGKGVMMMMMKMMMTTMMVTMQKILNNEARFLSFECSPPHVFMKLLAKSKYACRKMCTIISFLQLFESFQIAFLIAAQ